jgi:hypothetical protein
MQQAVVPAALWYYGHSGTSEMHIDSAMALLIRLYVYNKFYKKCKLTVLFRSGFASRRRAWNVFDACGRLMMLPFLLSHSPFHFHITHRAFFMSKCRESRRLMVIRQRGFC